MSLHSLARFTDCFEDVGVSCPTKHVGDVAASTAVWTTDDTLSVTPRRRLRHDTDFLSATRDFIAELCAGRSESEPKSFSSSKPSSTSGTGDSKDDGTLHLD